MLIVGGGIAGIVAALRASEHGWTVTLVERQPVLGGLLASVRPAGGKHSFDFGTHIPAATGDDELDALLFGGMRDEEWRVFPVLHAGTFWNGRLSPDSACLDLRTLSPSDYAGVLTEMLDETVVPAVGFETLAAQLTAVYGPRLLKTVFEPTLRKFYGLGAAELAPDAHRLFGLVRFLCLDPETARKVKRNPVLDGKVGLHDFRETVLGAPTHLARYPRAGGVGRWIDHLARKLADAGVNVRLGVGLSRLDAERGVATTTAEETLEFDQLGWSLPPSQLLRLLPHSAAASWPSPRLATATLYHFLTESEPLPLSLYVTCYDPAFRLFRVTLYRNLQPDVGGPARITVELISTEANSPRPSPEEIFDELRRMNVMAEEAQFLRCFTQELGPAFPLQTPALHAANRHAAECVAVDFPQAFLLGRAAGNGFFMRDVLLDVCRTVARVPGPSAIARPGTVMRRIETMIAALRSRPARPGSIHSH